MDKIVHVQAIIKPFFFENQNIDIYPFAFERLHRPPATPEPATPEPATPVTEIAQKIYTWTWEGLKIFWLKFVGGGLKRGLLEQSKIFWLKFVGGGLKRGLLEQSKIFWLKFVGGV